eukprot:gene10602-22137_t
MIRAVTILALVASAVAFMPMNRMVARQQMSMSAENIQSKISKALAVAAMGAALYAPVSPAMADGAVSASTVYRARTSYGAKIADLEKAVNNGNFGAFEDKKVSNAFDLFISGANKLSGKAGKEKAATEKKIAAEIFSAAKAKDAGKLKAAYSEFIKVAELKSEFGPNDNGQTDSSGYSPTWGTARQQIYQR